MTEARPLNASLRRRVADRLETGAWQGPVARLASSLWSRIADPVRPVELPRGCRLVGIGGATLGGSGKTPVASALALALGRQGVSTAIVVRTYPGRAPTRIALPSDSADAIGDEAAWLCRSLSSHGVRIIASSDRNRALRLASEQASVVILDAVLQTRPQPLDLSVLVLDGEAPWGAGRCPPAGDLRAEPDRLVHAADVILVQPGHAADLVKARSAGKRVLYFDQVLRGVVDQHGVLLSMSALSGLRLGLVLAIARPRRVLETLSQHGVVPERVQLLGDHERFGASPAPCGTRLDAWLTTEKCRPKLASTFGGAPVWTLALSTELPAELIELAALGKLKGRSTAERTGCASVSTY